MVRLARWRLVLAAAMTLTVISSPVAAQDLGTVTAATPEATAAAPVATEAATSAPEATATAAAAVAAEVVTEAPPAATEAAAPAATEAATTSAPASTPTATTEAATTAAPMSAPESTESTSSAAGSSTTQTPTSAPSAAEVASESNATVLQDTTSSHSSLRNSETGSNASSLSSASKSADATSHGTLNGSSSTKTLVICLLGGVGLTIIVSLLFVVWRSQKRENPDLGTPTQSDTATITFPSPAMPSIVAPTAQDLTAWKTNGPSFASQDLPLDESFRAKLNASTRLSAEYDLSSQSSQITSLPPRGTTRQTPKHHRGTNASSEQSFSVRGYSELSALRAGDSETAAMAFGRYSMNDRYSTSERYSTNDRYSTSSRLSSDPGRSNSGLFQNQVPKSLDMHRFSSTSSTTSSIVARKHNPVSFINHDLTQTPTADAPVTTESTTSRTDVPDWYSVIESPTDNDRYTASSLDSDNISDERASFEL
ncbi:unnamed protein product [Phytophthora fragariaefolia]|uniref:Unnamed protein product n=1 Tax=Phytophthora fragariaefolia TaxID=1490495 RepID=A0A9W6X6X3_9STRA|nr:unnamed protein product [Phytophthora fragariaefolia]